MINKNLIFISFIFLFMFVVANVNAEWTTDDTEQAYYFIEHDESGDPLASGSIWVNGSFDDTTFYVYYNGDSYNSDYDNGDNVFEFFDDFDYPNNALNTTKWDILYSYSVVVSDGIVYLDGATTTTPMGDLSTSTIQTKNAVGLVNTTTTSYTKVGKTSNNNYGSPAHIIYFIDTNNRYAPAHKTTESTNKFVSFQIDGGSITYYDIGDWGQTDFQKFSFTRNQTHFINDINNVNKISFTYTNTNPAKIQHQAYRTTSYVYMDWVATSKLNSYSTSYGSEESGSWEIDGITYSKRKEVEMTGTFDGQIELDYDEFNSENITITTYAGIDLISIVSPINTEYLTSDILINITNSTEVDEIWYNWNGTNVTYTTPVTVTFPAGEQTLYAWANNTSGDEQELSVTFDVYLNPTPASFNHSVQLVRNDNNITLSWTLGNDTYELTNQTLYIFDLNNNLINNYSLLNTTTTYNYTNNITNVYYAILETCNIYPLCSNSTISNKFSFQSIEFVEWPTLVTSLETYNIKFISSATNVERTTFSGEVCPMYSNPVCQVINGVETNQTNDCFACSCQPTTTYYYGGHCGVGNSTNITYCSSAVCGKEIIIRDDIQYYTTYVNPYYQTSFNTALYENQTYSFKALNYYKLEGKTIGIETDIKNLTIYNFSLGECSDASGFINYTLVDESESLMTGDIGTFIRVNQPLGDINATLNMSSDNHLQFCITPKKNYTLSSDIYYIADAIGRTEEYYLNDAVYDTTQDNILYLYNLNNTDILNVVVLDEFSSKQIGSVVNLIKFYPDTMSSKTIASAKTNSEGEVNFFYDRNDQIKLTVVEDGITEYQDSEFNKYYSITGYYSRTVKLGSGIIPTIDNINFDCQTSAVNETNNMVYCWFVVTDGKQRNFSLWVYDSGFNYIDILNGTYANSTSYETTGIYTTDGSLYISSDVLSGLYEFKIDGITRKSGVLNYNGSALPVELKYLTLPFVFLVLILGAINPFFALGGFFILGLFSDPTTSTFMFFDNNFILGSVVAIIIAFVIEEVKAVTKKR